MALTHAQTANQARDRVRRTGAPVVGRSVVLVTGANRGIGQRTASLLAEHGYRVFGTAAKPTAEDAEGIELAALDVTSDESINARAATVLERAGRIDVLVNNAALGLIGAIEETSIEEARNLFETNFFGVAKMVNAVLPSMRERRSGLIINFGSLAATLPIPFHAYLSSFKAAVNPILRRAATRAASAGRGSIASKSR